MTRLPTARAPSRGFFEKFKMFITNDDFLLKETKDVRRLEAGALPLLPRPRGR
jgi:hypothetical protein